MTTMRHRLFHAVVIAALPACGSTTPPVSPDPATKDATADTTMSATDSATNTDSATTETTIVFDTASEEVDANCYCKPGCLPCIK